MIDGGKRFRCCYCRKPSPLTETKSAQINRRIVKCFVDELSPSEAARATEHDIKTVRARYRQLIEGIDSLASVHGLETWLDIATGRPGAELTQRDTLPLNTRRLLREWRSFAYEDAWIRQCMEEWPDHRKCRFFEMLLSGSDLMLLADELIDPENGRSDTRNR